MRVFLISLIVAAIAVSSGCGDNGQPSEQRRARGDLKADLTGSCVGFCGKMSTDGCWCDDLCTQYNDCCQDKVTACKPASGCKTNCDCDQEQLCTPEGTCVYAFAPAYCCTKPGCQAGFQCQNPDGTLDTCGGQQPPPACKVDCDCLQGELCAQGQCVTGIVPAYCCTKPGCQAGWPCENPDGSKGNCAGTTGCGAMDAKGKPGCQAVLGFAWDGKACVMISGCGCTGADCGKLYKTLTDCQQAKSSCNPPPPPPPPPAKCKVDCDCDQGQLCTSDGQCLYGFVPAYCCTKPDCQANWPCENPDGSKGTCP